jgi:hypothetical protein
MQFERSAHLRLDAQGPLEVSAAGVAFATTTGDILEVSSCGPGTFRLPRLLDLHRDIHDICRRAY